MKPKLKSQWSGEKGRIEAVYKVSWARQIFFCMCQCLIDLPVRTMIDVNWTKSNERNQCGCMCNLSIQKGTNHHGTWDSSAYYSYRRNFHRFCLVLRRVLRLSWNLLGSQYWPWKSAPPASICDRSQAEWSQGPPEQPPQQWETAGEPSGCLTQRSGQSGDRSSSSTSAWSNTPTLRIGGITVIHTWDLKSHVRGENNYHTCFVSRQKTHKWPKIVDSQILLRSISGRVGSFGNACFIL